MDLKIKGRSGKGNNRVIDVFVILLGYFMCGLRLYGLHLVKDLICNN